MSDNMIPEEHDPVMYQRSQITDEMFFAGLGGELDYHMPKLLQKAVTNAGNINFKEEEVFTGQ